MNPSSSRRLACVTLLAIVTIFGARALHAQIALGETIRITKLGFQYSGKLLRVDSSGVALQPETGDTLTLSLEGIERSERLVGHHRGGASRFILATTIGTLTGAILGASAARGTHRSPSGGEQLPLDGTVYSLLGAVAGMIYGTIWSQTWVDEWIEFNPRQFAMIGSLR